MVYVPGAVQEKSEPMTVVVEQVLSTPMEPTMICSGATGGDTH